MQTFNEQMTEIMNTRFREIFLNNQHTSWEIGGAPVGYTAIMNEVRDADGELILSWVENVED